MFTPSLNKWVKITGTDKADVISMLEENKQKIIATFKDFDIQNIQETHIGNSYEEGYFNTLTNLGNYTKHS